MNTETSETRTDAVERWDLANERFACDHDGLMVLTIFTDSLRRPHCRYQCSRCGGWLAAKKCDVSPAEYQNASPFNPQIEAEWTKQKQAYTRELFDAEREASRAKSLDTFRNEEEEFLASPRWSEMRRLVLKRANGICEGCLTRRATQVHHVNYDRRFGREMLFDLRAVCGGCHDAIHDPEDKRVP
jgi:hypothetical protein